jgi:hypothetical protein
MTSLLGMIGGQLAFVSLQVHIILRSYNHTLVDYGLTLLYHTAGTLELS